jgi:hypothetical protein
MIAAQVGDEATRRRTILIFRDDPDELPIVAVPDASVEEILLLAEARVDLGSKCSLP